MKKFVNKRILFILLELMLFFTGLTQERQYNFSHIDETQGLSNRKVNCIYRDSDGFLWICTNNGLNRYDGKDFKVYKNVAEDTTSISSNFVTAIAEDKLNRLWIGSGHRGLNLYNKYLDNFRQFKNDPDDSLSIGNNSINTIFATNDSCL